jgi:hypothetical protein
MPNSPPETRASLILRLRNADDMAAWEGFTELYGPVGGRSRPCGTYAQNHAPEVRLLGCRSLERGEE